MSYPPDSGRKSPARRRPDLNRCSWRVDGLQGDCEPAVGIPLTARGRLDAFAVVDAADARLLAADSWALHRSDTKVYARRSDGAFMHRIIASLGSDDRRVVDHINGDSLDNRRANLRIVTTAGNAQNQGSRGGSSPHRGVSWDRVRRKWMAQAQLNGRKVTIGRYATEDEAGAAAAEWRARNMPHSIEGMAA